MVALARAVVGRRPGRHHGRADLLAGTARGRDALPGRRASCATQGIAVVYVSHRLDELYELCDRVTVLRDGRVVHTGPMAELDRLTLVSHDARPRSGPRCGARASRGSAIHDGASDRRALLRVDAAAQAPVSHGISFDVRPARSPASAACSARAAARRPRRSSARCRSTPAAVTVGGKRAEAASPPRRRSARGSRCCPRTARPRASSPTCRSARTSCWRRCPASPAAGIVSRGKQDRDRRDVHGTAADQGVQPRAEGVASSPAATSRRCCSPAGCAWSRGCCCSTSPPAASTWAPRPRCRSSSTSWPATGSPSCSSPPTWRSWSRAPTAWWCCAAGAVVGELAGDDVSEHAIMAAIAAGGRR